MAANFEFRTSYSYTTYNERLYERSSTPACPSARKLCLRPAWQSPSRAFESARNDLKVNTTLKSDRSARNATRTLGLPIRPSFAVAHADALSRSVAHSIPDVKVGASKEARGGCSQDSAGAPRQPAREPDGERVEPSEREQPLLLHRLERRQQAFDGDPPHLDELRVLEPLLRPLVDGIVEVDLRNVQRRPIEAGTKGKRGQSALLCGGTWGRVGTALTSTTHSLMVSSQSPGLIDRTPEQWATEPT